MLWDAKPLQITIGLIAVAMLTSCDSTHIGSQANSNIMGVNRLSLDGGNGYCDSITIDVHGTRLLGIEGSNNKTPDIALQNPIPAGNYGIRLHYEDPTHPDQPDQLREQWYAELLGESGAVVLMTPESEDLPTADVVGYTDIVNQVIAEDIYAVRAVHAYESDSYNSIYPVSIELYLECNTSKNSPPEIALVGANPLNLFLYDRYIDPGATATDREDGDISSRIIIDSDNVNMDVPGIYIVTYDVKDNSGNAATQETRTVMVKIGEEGPALESAL